LRVSPELKRPVPTTEALHLTVSQADSRRECIIIQNSNGCGISEISATSTGEQWEKFYRPGLDWTNVIVQLYREGGDTEGQRFAVTYGVSQPSGPSCLPPARAQPSNF
jgi:hypothetical protein